VIPSVIFARDDDRFFVFVGRMVLGGVCYVGQISRRSQSCSFFFRPNIDSVELNNLSSRELELIAKKIDELNRVYRVVL